MNADSVLCERAEPSAAVETERKCSTLGEVGRQAILPAVLLGFVGFATHHYYALSIDSPMQFGFVLILYGWFMIPALAVFSFLGFVLGGEAVIDAFKLIRARTKGART
jgi:hypothetical protein